MAVSVALIEIIVTEIKKIPSIKRRVKKEILK